jgi:ABC-type multidrug transport system fused ATPase/permease subunit
MKYIKSLFWVVKLQFNAARWSFAFNTGYYLYDGAVSIAYTYIGAQLITSVTKVALQDAEASPVYMWLIALFGLQLLTNLLNSINRIVELRIEQKLEIMTNDLLFRKMYSLSQEQFDNEEFNTKLARADDGIRQLSRAMSEINWTVSSLVRFIGAIGAIFFVSPLIGLLIMIAAVPVALAGVRQNKIREKMYKDTESIDRIGMRSRWVLVDPHHMPEVRLINGFKSLYNSWLKNTKKINNEYIKTDKKLFKYDLIEDFAQPLIEVIANVYFFRLLVAGSIGLDRIIFLRGLIDQASNSALSLARSVDKLHQISINLGNFEEVYNTAPAIPDGSVSLDAPLTIELKNVSFTYPGTKLEVLNNVSLKIVPGSKLALVGENGAGKSTLIKLLLRQYLPTSGQIVVNGHDIKDVKLESYYKALSILSQDFMILHHLTIKDNLLLGVNEHRSTQDVSHALELTGADRFINKLPHKLAQRLDSSFDDGSSLSGGQMQRLGVARSLLRRGDIMILDEPTSAIDAKGEFSIFNNIYKEHAGKTTLIVSHRFSTVRKADMVIVMENGKIIEYGSHEELMKYKGLYEEMFSLQAEGYK